MEALYKCLKDLQTLPRKEYLTVLYKGEPPTVDISYIDYLEKSGVTVPAVGTGNYRSLHPAIIFIALAAPIEILKSDREPFPGRLKQKCDIIKVTTDDYAINVYDDQGTRIYINMELKIPLCISGLEDFLIHFDKCKLSNNLRRHPQLKRLVKKYCDSKDIYFNDSQLKIALENLSTSSDIYSYYDADEYILFVNPDETYF